MQLLLEKSNQDLSSKSPDYNHGLGLQLLQASRDEQAQEEFNLLCEKFRRWPYKLYQFWLVLSFFTVLTAEYCILDALTDFIAEAFFFFMGYVIAGAGLLSLLYGCGQMFYAIKKKKSKIAQKGLRKFQYSMIICMVGLFVILWFVNLEAYLKNWPTGRVILSTLVIIPVSNLVGGFVVVKAFKESQKLARENTCDASDVSEEVNPFVKDFLRQNETIEAEVLKYDEQLERFGPRCYRCWLRFIAVFEILRLFCYLYLVITTLLPGREDYPGENYAVIALSLSSFLCLYSCFNMENAIAKRFARSSEKAVIALKVCIPMSFLSHFFLGKGVFGSPYEKEPLEVLLFLNIILFGYCSLIPILTLIGAIKVHKIIKERDHFAQFSSLTDASSHL